MTKTGDELFERKAWPWQQDYAKIAPTLFDEHLNSPLSKFLDVTHLIDLVPQETWSAQVSA